MTFKSKLSIASFLLLLISAPLYALPEDKTQPIQLEADQAKLNNETGISEYLGNVVIIQGTAQLRADRVILHTANNEVVRMEAFGSPAKYQQILQPNEPPTHIEGNTLDLKIADQLAEVTGNGKVFKGEDKLSSEKITYSLKTGELNATKSENSSDSRVRFIFHPPEKKSDKSASPSTDPKPQQ
ncbi:lipopolysaccharide transport periplasmic protein LptA [Litoribrevibacter albus]|uniref:Lipopolysaccharide export system protein LptA n=1 Tax=Litoribrevibacter albus TaxID=1473156 RepID=A0AA37SAE5_9GAMM|nr:lipopolysaccharide transport periplasmic protein LptA [Litoribrevibacter albus]GLQ31298.1 lipopolysaccharide export system protein LptA [Litoribrevibacter albus]